MVMMASHDASQPIDIPLGGRAKMAHTTFAPSFSVSNPQQNPTQWMHQVDVKMVGNHIGQEIS